MNKIKKELLKALLSMHGQKKICDCLNEIDSAFDILLREQKEEMTLEGEKSMAKGVLRRIEKERSLEHIKVLCEAVLRLKL